MPDPDLLLLAIDDAVLAVNEITKLGGRYRRNWGAVLKSIVPWDEEPDHSAPRVMLTTYTQPLTPGAQNPYGLQFGGEMSSSACRYMEILQWSANVSPDVALDGSLDIITPVQDFRADMHTAMLYYNRNRNSNTRVMTFYMDRRSSIIVHGTQVVGAVATEIYGIQWQHRTGDMSAPA